MSNYLLDDRKYFTIAERGEVIKTEERVTRETTLGQRFLAAAEVIRVYGHHKGSVGNTVVGFCTLGALGYVGANAPEFREQTLDALHSLVPEVVIWNDSMTTSLDEVVALLERIADGLG